MLKLLLFVLLAGFAAFRISRWLWTRFAPSSPLNTSEAMASLMLVFAALWLAIAWALAMPMWMTSTSLLLAALIVAAAASMLKAPWRIHPIRISAVVWIAIVSLASWAAFLLWRGYVAPPVGPDTLTYHMPRALFFSRAGGYRHFGLPETRIDGLAANYELLVATIIDFCRNDTITEWLSTFFWAFFVIQVGATSMRWSKDAAASAVTVLVAASAPVVLLQGAAHKNDIMTAAFFLAAFHWVARWRTRGEIAAAILTIVAVAAAIGTKAHGLVLAAVLLPFAIRRMPWRQVVAFTAFSIAAIALLGGEHYVYRSGARAAAATRVSARIAPAPWGDFTNVIEVPLLMWMAPFSSDDIEVPVPWRHESWLWQRYDLYGSNFGVLISLLVLALPLSIPLWRRDERSSERRIVTAAALIVFAIVLPAVFRPRGYVSGFPRYTLFIMPLVAAGATLPLVTWLRERSGAAAGRVALLLALFVALYFADAAWLYARFDKWAPLMSVRWAAAHRDSRWLPNEPKRAAFFVDRIAGPNDLIDVHGGFDTWIYPAFGRLLHRDIHYINDASEIRPGARWVVIDRAFSSIWGVKGFERMGDWKHYMGGAWPTQDDFHVITQLANRSDFQLLYLDKRSAQAVFRRR